MKKTFLFSTLALGILACNQENSVEQKTGDVQYSIVAENQSEEERVKELEQLQTDKKKAEAKELSERTSLTFNELRHDFGDVTTGSENTTLFEVKNTGDKPLVISSVSASCGCTTPRKPEAPILPGQTDVIEVTFKPKPGQKNEIVKTVTVNANTEEKIHKLEIRAFVK